MNWILEGNIYNQTMTDFNNIKIAVAGTGYVGLSIATLLSQHHHVTAVDVIPEKVEMLNKRISPIQDLSLDMHRSMNQKRIIDGGNARSNEVMLPNGQIAKIGDHIYDSKKNMEIGEVVGTDSNAIYLRNPKGIMELIDIIGPYANNLCVMPF